MFPLTHLGGQLHPLPSILDILIDLVTVGAISMLSSEDEEGILMINGGCTIKGMRKA